MLVLTLLLIGMALLLSNLQWFREPLQRTVSAALHREVSIGDMHVRWSGMPIVVLSDVALANLQGGSEPRMVLARSVEITLAPLELLRGRIFLPRVAVDEVDVLLERLNDGRSNWVIGNEKKANKEEPPSRLQVGAISLTRGRIRFLDHKVPVAVTVQVKPLDGQSEANSRRTDAPPVNNRYATGFDIRGEYRGNPFSGSAQSGNVVSLKDSGLPFPLKLDLTLGETRLQMEGTIADVLQVSGVDMRLQIAGPTLANIYPLLLLPLPASPPYNLHGRLRRDGGRYALEELGGRIGSTDLQGEGSYVVRKPRPLLTVQLRSQLLNIADLGPLVGIETKSRTAKPTNQKDLSTREKAKQTDRSTRGERILPAGKFEPERLRVIDADFRLQAQRVKGIATVPLENFDAVVRLQDAVLKLDSLKLGAAGGTLVGHATLDARRGDVLRSQVQAEVRRLHIDQLIPKKSKLAKGAGVVNMSAELSGSGNSIADAAAKAEGRLAAVMFQGQISNLLDAASGLALGRVLALLAKGDREINLNCGAAVFDVKDGKGQSSLFVLDTEQTQVLGSGQFDFGQETIGLHVEPKPKAPGVLSLRTPLNVKGTFNHVDVSLEKTPLVARAGAALALALVAPPAALLALIETGPGEDTPCSSVLREAIDPKGKNKDAAKNKVAPKEKESPKDKEVAKDKETAADAR
jgi:uncharacterized protein involved in outer membrane biogenesis